MEQDSQVFPGQISAKRPISKDSALAKLKEKRAALNLLRLASNRDIPR